MHHPSSCSLQHHISVGLDHPVSLQIHCHFSFMKNKLLTSHICPHPRPFLFPSSKGLLERPVFLSWLCLPPFPLVPSNRAFTLNVTPEGPFSRSPLLSPMVTLRSYPPQPVSSTWHSFLCLIQTLSSLDSRTPHLLFISCPRGGFFHLPAVALLSPRSVWASLLSSCTHSCGDFIQSHGFEFI